VAQAIVLKIGFRTVVATGMAPIGAGSLPLTQVSVGASYLGDRRRAKRIYGRTRQPSPRWMSVLGICSRFLASALWP
jgi:hypothetical protein